MFCWLLPLIVDQLADFGEDRKAMLLYIGACGLIFDLAIVLPAFLFSSSSPLN